MLNFERTGLGSFSHILQFWKSVVEQKSCFEQLPRPHGFSPCQSRALSESFPAKKLRMGFERKTASEGAGIGG